MIEPAPRLDDDARRALDLAAAAGRRPLEQMNVAEARAAARANQQLFDAVSPPVHTDDLSLPGPASEIPLRRYRPLGKDMEEPLPTLVYFHGGGWVAGDLDHGAWLCASLAQRLGIAVVSVGYRLAPEHPFPAATDDALAALEGIAGDRGVIGVDQSRLAVLGDSAGGALAAVAAIHARNVGLPLRLQVLLYPVTDIAVEHPSYVRNGSGFGFTADGMRWYRRHYLGDADPRDWRASPGRAERLEGVAPAYVLSCGFDLLCDEAIAYADRLRGAGVSVRQSHYSGQIHGFLTRAGVIAEAARALAEIEAVLRKTLLS
jgi:acetyl esterase